MSWVWVLMMWVSTGSDLVFRIWVWVNHGGFLVWWPWWIKLGFVVLVWDLWFWIDQLGGHGFFTAKFICDLYGGRGNEFRVFFFNLIVGMD